MSKYLTWDDLADLYGERTGGTARIRPMDEIYDWAVSQPDIKETGNGLILNKKEASEEPKKRPKLYRKSRILRKDKP